MIYTVTLNPAVDRELIVADMQFDSVLRASESRVDFGGKGFNVSRLLKRMGTASTAIGFVGGRAGQLLQAGLQGLGIDTDFVWVAGETRTNVSIMTQSHEHYIKVNEAGPGIDAAGESELLDKIDDLAKAGDWWVLAGSLPPGVDVNFYGRIIAMLNAHGARAILDTAGDALRLGCGAKPYMVKPNVEEASAITGMPGRTPEQVAAMAAAICRIGAQNALVSMGKAGALLKTNEGTWLARSPHIEQKNPIGAGDSMVGGLVWALSHGLDFSEALRWAVASGAATASLDATEVGSKPLIKQLLLRVHSERLGLSQAAE